MLNTANLSLNFGERKLFDNVNLKFTSGNCYGIIGANGAGKSTFMKILSGQIEPSSGELAKDRRSRLSFLKQDHHEYDNYQVLDTIIMGNKDLYEICQKKDALYNKPDFNEQDGILASELESQFSQLGGWESESEASVLINGLGLNSQHLNKKMNQLVSADKVKVLLAQALFGNPDILLLDEPTNDLDLKAIKWLESFLLNFKNTVILVSHDRHFLNKVCTHVVDIDFGKMTIYSGNYNFWLQASELNMRLRSDQRKKAEEKAKELKTFIARFSANAAKSKQATSRQKILDSLDLSSLPISNRKYPHVKFECSRSAGKDILTVQGLCYESKDQVLLKDLDFTLDKKDKVVVIGNDLQQSSLLSILAGRQKQSSGQINWGVTTSRCYYPNDHNVYFKKDNDYTLITWLSQFTDLSDDFTFLRSFLGRMLFSGDDVNKKISVLSGGERVRAILAKMMLEKANVLLLDRPTSHLDLESITSLNQGLASFEETIVFCSTDHEFIQTIANRIIVLSKDGRIVYDKKTDFESYLKSQQE